MNQTKYLQDVRLDISTDDPSLWSSLGSGNFSIKASRAKFQHKALENTTIRNLALDSVMEGMDEIKLAGTQFGHPVAYNFMYVQWEANRIISKQLIRNMSLTFGVIFVVSLLLIADPVVSLLVFLCVVLSVLEIIE